MILCTNVHQFSPKHCTGIDFAVLPYTPHRTEYSDSIIYFASIYFTHHDMNNSFI